MSTLYQLLSNLWLFPLLVSTWLKAVCWCSKCPSCCFTVNLTQLILKVVSSYDSLWHHLLVLMYLGLEHAHQMWPSCLPVDFYLETEVLPLSIPTKVTKKQLLPMYFFSNSPVACLLTKVVFPVPPSPTSTSCWFKVTISYLYWAWHDKQCELFCSPDKHTVYYMAHLVEFSFFRNQNVCKTTVFAVYLNWKMWTSTLLTGTLPFIETL